MSKTLKNILTYAGIVLLFISHNIMMWATIFVQENTMSRPTTGNATSTSWMQFGIKEQ